LNSEKIWKKGKSNTDKMDNEEEKQDMNSEKIGKIWKQIEK
jgi:hypothetical protein